MLNKTHLNLAGEVRQLVDAEDAAIGPRQQAVVNRQLVGQLQPAARRLDRIDVAHHVGDGHVRRRELLDVARRRAAAMRSACRRLRPRCGAGTPRRWARTGRRGSRSRRPPADTRRAATTSARRIRLFAWPRRPSRMKLCRDRMALTSCGMTVSSYPMMPGNSGSPVFSFVMRLSRTSFFTDRRGNASGDASRARRRVAERLDRRNSVS